MEPTKEDLKDPKFKSVWSVIRNWDICRNKESLNPTYSGATGTDVMEILEAIK